ncbi:MAG: diguanylate cyclase [Coriobacteriia bacterium]|nr:diguanylate cyclase [Coriobacteriia bacterium]
MRAILTNCAELDTIAHATYESMAKHTGNPDLALVFTQLSAEEGRHIGWWNDLAVAWDKGLLPDIINDTEGLVAHLDRIRSEVSAMLPIDFAGVSDDEMLDIAARMEFFMTDPLFGELLELTEPGQARSHREAYARHLERVVGAIEVHYSRSDLGKFFAGVIRRAWRDNLALTRFATRDPLTALHNRRGLMSYLEQWMSWAQRYRRPLGLLLIDVDDFKRVNDTLGHGVGDLALKAVSSALERTVRGSDFVARYGGDEFAIVAPESDVAELTQLGARLVEAVATLGLRDLDRDTIELSISVGGAVLTPANGPDDDIDRFLAAADRSLYEAKRAGKARTAQIAEFPAAFGSD